MSLAPLLIKVLLLQVFITVAIGFTLFHILNRHLSEEAVQKFETLYPKDLDPAAQEILVDVYFIPPEKYIQRIKKTAYKKFKRELKLTVQKNNQLKGGMVIKVNDLVLDYSLAARLKESGFAKRA